MRKFLRVRSWHRPSPALIVALVALFVALGGVGYAAVTVSGKNIKNNSVTTKDIKNNSLRGKDIKNNSLRGKDIRNKSIACRDLTAGLNKSLGNCGKNLSTGTGQPGQPGSNGQNGTNGTNGTNGVAQYANPEWSAVLRNTIGSALAQLGAGPVVIDPASPPNTSRPPFGVGSLKLAVSNNANGGGTPQDKASFGNETEFFGDLFGELTEVGFHVFTTRENVGRGEPMPNIAFEIDPNLSSTPSNFSTATYVPEDPTAATLNKWSPYIDATTTGEWLLTGAAATATGCNAANPCTFDELQAALDDGGDPTIILTAAITKGRDSGFVGAVDGFRINATIYDFEPFGVLEVAP